METRTCKKCGERPSSNFRSYRQYGETYIYTTCRECQKAYNLKWHRDNVERKRIYQGQWRTTNAKGVKRYRDVYYQANQERILEHYRKYARAHRPALNSAKRKYTGKRRATDPLFRLRESIRLAIIKSLRNGKSGHSWESLVGYSLTDLKQHMEARFQKGMSWANYGDWHIDHIRPIASFRFDHYSHPAFRACWVLANLQPLWAKDNIAKGARQEGGGVVICLDD